MLPAWRKRERQMKVLRTESVPVVKIEMRVDVVRPAERGTVQLIEKTPDGNFQVWVPKKYGEHIAPGATIKVVCIPDPGLGMAKETLALAIVKGTGTEWLFAEDGIASEMCHKP